MGVSTSVDPVNPCTGALSVDVSWTLGVSCQSLSEFKSQPAEDARDIFPVRAGCQASLLYCDGYRRRGEKINHRRGMTVAWLESMMGGNRTHRPCLHVSMSLSSPAQSSRSMQRREARNSLTWTAQSPSRGIKASGFLGVSPRYPSTQVN